MQRECRGVGIEKPGGRAGIANSSQSRSAGRWYPVVEQIVSASPSSCSRSDRAVLAITGFTVGHSLTLSLATLSGLRMPVAPMEACIALSVMFLASEIVRGRRHTALWRHPLAVAMAFGLLHGFGFASVPEEIGLPRRQVVVTMLFFNPGVEAGQFPLSAAAFALAAG